MLDHKPISAISCTCCHSALTVPLVMLCRQALEPFGHIRSLTHAIAASTDSSDDDSLPVTRESNQRGKHRQPSRRQQQPMKPGAEIQDVDPANRQLLYVAFDILYMDGQV